MSVVVNVAFPGPGLRIGRGGASHSQSGATRFVGHTAGHEVGHPQPHPGALGAEIIGIPV